MLGVKKNPQEQQNPNGAAITPSLLLPYTEKGSAWRSGKKTGLEKNLNIELKLPRSHTRSVWLMKIKTNPTELLGAIEISILKKNIKKPLSEDLLFPNILCFPDCTLCLPAPAPPITRAAQ